MTTLASTGTAHDLDDGRTPAWIYVTGVVAILLSLLIVILHLTGHVPTGH